MFLKLRIKYWDKKYTQALILYCHSVKDKENGDIQYKKFKKLKRCSEKLVELENRYHDNSGV